jgi:hypothetical protein
MRSRAREQLPPLPAASRLSEQDDDLKLVRLHLIPSAGVPADMLTVPFKPNPPN